MTDQDTAGRRVVVVLGMHRSGTSLLAAILSALGVDLGDRLLRAPVPDNAMGYWEHEGIVAAQEAILAALGRDWHLPQGTLPFPPGWPARDDVRAERARLRAILVTETARAGPGGGAAPWGFKDPRTMRLLPLWRDLFAELGLRPAYVLAIRHPSAVAGSLASRDAMPPARAELLWLQHTLDALAECGSDLAAVVPYDRWFDDPVGLARGLARRLGLQWTDEEGGAGASSEAAVRTLVRDDLRHNRPDRTEARLPGIDTLYAALAEAAPAPPDAGLSDPWFAFRARAEATYAAWAEDADAALERGRRLAAALAAEEAAHAAEREAHGATRAHALTEKEAAEAHFADERERARAYLATERERAAAFARDLARLQQLYADCLRERDSARRIANAFVADPAATLDASWNAASFRPFRAAARLADRITGRPARAIPRYDTPEAYAEALAALYRSDSWELAGPIRVLARRLRRRR